MAVSYAQWLGKRGGTPNPPPKKKKTSRGTADVNDGSGTSNPVATTPPPRTSGGRSTLGRRPGTYAAGAPAPRATPAERKAARLETRQEVRDQTRAERMERRGGPEGYQGPEATVGGIYTNEAGNASPEYSGAAAKNILRLNTKYGRGTRAATWLNENAAGILARYGGAKGYGMFLDTQVAAGPKGDYAMRTQENRGRETQGDFTTPNGAQRTPDWYRGLSEGAQDDPRARAGFRPRPTGNGGYTFETPDPDARHLSMVRFAEKNGEQATETVGLGQNYEPLAYQRQGNYWVAGYYRDGAFVADPTGTYPPIPAM